jgi:hypothetical protein
VAEARGLRKSAGKGTSAVGSRWKPLKSKMDSSYFRACFFQNRQRGPSEVAAPLYSSTEIVELSLSYGRRSVDQFVLISGSPLGPMTNFILILSLVTVALLFFLYGALSDERTGL